MENKDEWLLVDDKGNKSLPHGQFVPVGPSDFGSSTHDASGSLAPSSTHESSRHDVFDESSAERKAEACRECLGYENIEQACEDESLLKSLNLGKEECKQMLGRQQNNFQQTARHHERKLSKSEERVLRGRLDAGQNYFVSGEDITVRDQAF